MNQRIDVHSHLIPAVDDGCQSLDDTLACARIFVKRGYSHCFCTPHIWPNLPHNNPKQIAHRVTKLQKDLDDAGIPLTLLPGGELNLSPHLQSAQRDDLPSYAMAGKHVLIDFWSDRLPGFFEPTMRHLQSLGFTVILAHPERMKAVHDDPGLANYFRDIGLLLQGNLGCLSDPPHTANRRAGERLLREGHYFTLGSDCHLPDLLPSRLDGLKTAVDVLGQEAVDRLTIENPGKLMKAE